MKAKTPGWITFVPALWMLTQIPFILQATFGGQPWCYFEFLASAVVMFWLMSRVTKPYRV